MGKVKDYASKVREADRVYQQAQTALNDDEGPEYPHELNKKAWEALQARRDAIRGR